MKLKITKTQEPVKDGKPKKLRIKGDKETKNQYGIYSGIVDEKGKKIDNPTEVQAIKNMAGYMKNNQSDQSDKPSNVYRPKFSHLSILYNRKKNQNET